MQINTFMSPDDIIVKFPANSKKQVLEDLVTQACTTVKGLDARMVLDQLMEREKLGCTGIGGGIAVPHARCTLPAFITQPLVRLAVLDRAIDFDANDDIPVDIVFLMLAPEGSSSGHLTALALISRIMRQKGCAKKMRQARSAQKLWEILSNESISDAA
jgi:PTS system nitrogen regulatory IIA component